MDKLLTVIVPVYKVEQYLKKCLDSLLVPEDLMKVMEVIVVNDGSPDNSSAIAHSYEDRYPNTFKVIDKENGGHGSAWNAGVKIASGKFIKFLDSDDWLHTDNLAKIIKELSHLETDLIFTDVSIYFANDERTERRSFKSLKKEVIYDGEIYDWSNLNNSTNFHYCFYRTKLIQSLHPLFLEKQSYDDSILKVVFIQKTKSFTYYPIIIYNYLIGRDEQTMNRNNMLKKYKDINNLILSMIDYYYNYPVNANKTKAIKKIIDNYCMEQFALLGELPYHKSKTELASFSTFIRKRYPQCRSSKRMTIYKKVPFFIYRIIIKHFR